MRDILIVIGLLVALGIAWYLTGGPERARSRSGPFLTLPTSRIGGDAFTIPRVGGTRSSGNDDDSDPLVTTISNYLGTFTEVRSPYSAYVRLERGRADSTIDDEYVTIRVSSDAPQSTTVSGWRLESTQSQVAYSIPLASGLAYLGVDNGEQPVTVAPNSNIYIHTGRSPVGLSFRTNLCTGYFEDHQDFDPKLKLDCPRAIDEADRLSPNMSDACNDAVEDINRCTMLDSQVAVDATCRNFVDTHLTYSGCVSDHKGDAGFYKNDWYLYLKKDSEVWRNRNERIRLIDETGKVVSVVTY